MILTMTLDAHQPATIELLIPAWRTSAILRARFNNSLWDFAVACSIEELELDDVPTLLTDLPKAQVIPMRRCIHV